MKRQIFLLDCCSVITDNFIYIVLLHHTSKVITHLIENNKLKGILYFRNEKPTVQVTL